MFPTDAQWPVATNLLTHFDQLFLLSDTGFCGLFWPRKNVIVNIFHCQRLYCGVKWPSISKVYLVTKSGKIFQSFDDNYSSFSIHFTTLFLTNVAKCSALNRLMFSCIQWQLYIRYWFVPITTYPMYYWISCIKLNFSIYMECI